MVDEREREEENSIFSFCIHYISVIIQRDKLMKGCIYILQIYIHIERIIIEKSQTNITPMSQNEDRYILKYFLKFSSHFELND
jgi:hypothetical protein